jgi:hypothetical protein
VVTINPVSPEQREAGISTEVNFPTLPAAAQAIATLSLK